MPSSDRDQRVFSGPVLPTFFYYVVPSLLGLLAISTASLVDGIFVGHFVGPHALAAINLLIPYFTLLFGASLMLAVGGSVRAGRYLGERNERAASAIFSKSVLGVLALSTAAAAISSAFDETLYELLGAPASLFPEMRSYFRVISIALVVQLVTLVVYYFVRLDGKPVLATAALLSGALANVALDALFIVYFQFGLAGAAWATALAQLLQLGVLLSHFASKQGRLGFSFIQSDWGELRRSAFNGASEFVNEVSVGIVMLVLNWLLVRRVGLFGVAAFTAVNYAIFASLMVYYGVADALHLLVSQNLGARNVARIRAFMQAAMASVLALSACFAVGLWGFGDWWLRVFLKASSPLVFDQAAEFLDLVWPLFLVNGLNVVFTVYLAATHRPLAAGVLALGKSLILPAAFLLILGFWAPRVPFLLALPLAEWTTFFAGAWLFARFRPESCLGPELPNARAEAVMS
jgi:Na+-driven multidrug efflux pump